MSIVKKTMGADVADVPAWGEGVPESVPARGLEQPHGSKWPIHYDSVEPLTILADLATIALASVSSSLLYDLAVSGEPGDISKSLGSAALVSALFISVMKIRGMYGSPELLVLGNQIRAVCLAWTSVFLLLAGTVFALKLGSEISRATNALFAMLGLISLVVQRSVLRALVAKGLAGKRFVGRNIILITDDPRVGDTALNQTVAGLGFCVKGNLVFPPSTAEPSQREEFVAQVIEYARGSDVEEIVVGADTNRWSDLRLLVAELRVLPFPVSFVPLGTTSELFRRPFRELGSAVCVEVQRGPLTSSEQAAKRCIDVLFAGMGLIVLLLPLVIVAIAIKLDSPGPVFFGQKRCGFNGRCFTIRKFRTMSVLEDGPSITQVQFADKRVTRLGTWLRRTSIDELPQLLNVLEGNMSLVGPRPHAVVHDSHFDKIVRGYAFRRRVKPGLTGWAQVNGYRGPTPTVASIERRVEYDLWYIDNWSLKLDLAILLQTPIEMLHGHNAL